MTLYKLDKTLLKQIKDKNEQKWDKTIMTQSGTNVVDSEVEYE